MEPTTKARRGLTAARAVYAEHIARECAKCMNKSCSHALKQQLSRSGSFLNAAVDSSNDEFYSSYLSVRSLPMATFLRGEQPIWVLPVSSISEARFLTALGVNRVEKQQIIGLGVTTRNHKAGDESFVSQEQHASRALVRLATDPPPAVGKVQRNASKWLLRPFPDGRP
jgi:hypothetical protein